MLLGDFNARVGTEDIFKLIIKKESLHKIINGDRAVVNFSKQ
jgi:hypothetical protein